VIAAIVAPPDPLSMLLMTLPLIVLFEATIWVAWWMERKKRTKD
jgi:sec-independent protein translocase protein TatC